MSTVTLLHTWIRSMRPRGSGVTDRNTKPLQRCTKQLKADGDSVNHFFFVSLSLSTICRVLTVRTAGLHPLLAAPKQEVHHGDCSPQRLPGRVGHRCRNRRGPPPGGQQTNRKNGQRKLRQLIQRRLLIGCRDSYLIQELLDDADLTSTWTQLLQQLNVLHLQHDSQSERSFHFRKSDGSWWRFLPEVWASGLVLGASSDL